MPRIRFRVWGRVQGVQCRVKGLSLWSLWFTFRVWGLGFWVWDLGLKVYDIGFWVFSLGLGSRILGFGFLV